MKETYNYVFHHDDIKNVWRCVNRIDYNNFWNSRNSINVGEGKTPKEAFNNLKKALVNERV